MKNHHPLVGEVSFPVYLFPRVDAAIGRLEKVSFTNIFQRQLGISAALHQLIQEDSSGLFLLPAIVDFMDKVEKKGLYNGYHISHFEYWVNQHSGLSFSEQYQLRGKMVGKWIPRSEYQAIFPLGNGKVYSGTHFVTAHSSPDLDTIVATFWGWMDAFSAKVSAGFHVWNVPEGPPSSTVEIDMLFADVFGKNVFSILSKNRTSLSLTALDLLTGNGVMQKYPQELTFDIEHDRNKTAVVVIDNEGNYVGDWRQIDVEGVRQVIHTFNSCYRWLENELHILLISLFAEKKVHRYQVHEVVQTILATKLAGVEPISELTMRQQKYLQVFLEDIVKIPGGLDANFKDFLVALEEAKIVKTTHALQALEELSHKKLFSSDDELLEDRPLIFTLLQKIVILLSKIFKEVKNFVDTLDISMKVKREIFAHTPSHLSYRADIEEVKAKMDAYPYLTVTLQGTEEELLPLGVIFAQDLYQEKLGTVTLRDFSNKEETKVPPYLDVISVIDHHKSSISTSSPAQTIIADAQSSNVITAKLSFAMNKGYSLGNMTLDQIEDQIAKVTKEPWSSSQGRILQRLIERKIAAMGRGKHFVSPDREFMEYKHYIHAIFDDTDLLTKMTPVDVEVVKDLLNRLKSLQLRNEVEIVHFDDIPQDENFVKSAAKRLLQNEDLYSLYAKVYQRREEVASEQLIRCARGEKSDVFADTKTQNGAARVGQTKLFQKNIPLFHQYVDKIREIWVDRSKKTLAEQPVVELYMHMISTIAGAEDLYKGNAADYHHKDELWFYIPNTESATELLKLFLSSFQTAPGLVFPGMELELLGDNAHDLAQVFKESFPQIPVKSTYRGLPIAVLYYKAGTLNSRKTQISPFLPKK